MKSASAIILLLSVALRCSATDRLDSLVAMLRVSDYMVIEKARAEIMGFEEGAIPKLVELLYDTTHEQLTNTCDLIYPGATSYYGHGAVSPYDLNWVCVRAAWIIEEITFVNFHYRYSEWYVGVGLQGPSRGASVPKDGEDYLLLADSVNRWWNKNSGNWNRFSGLKSALNSNDSSQVLNALTYLREGKTDCQGLTKETYTQDIVPLIENVSVNPKFFGRIHELSGYLLRDKNLYCLKIKRIIPW